MRNRDEAVRRAKELVSQMTLEEKASQRKRRNNPDGTFTYDKHKIFLYKEDFDKFKEGLDEVIKYITDNCFGGEIPVRPETQPDQEGYF